MTWTTCFASQDAARLSVVPCFRCSDRHHSLDPFGNPQIAVFNFQFPILACAACFGRSDSPMAHGFNWGILSLLAVVIVVLGGFSAFFAFLAKRSAALAAIGATAPSLSAPQPHVTNHPSPITNLVSTH